MGWMPTSLASMSTMVAVMRTHRVSSWVTGCWRSVPESGGMPRCWLACLAEQVTSIEIAPDLATHARTALSDAGFGAVTVINADGVLGSGVATPYGRVIAIAVCQNVPYTWVDQTSPGGRIVTCGAIPASMVACSP